MKIALLYSHLSEFGGIERVILKQVELLRSWGHEAVCHFAYVDQKTSCDGMHAYGNPTLSRSYFNFPVPNNEALRVVLSLPLAPLISRVFKDMDLLICHGYGPAPWIGYLARLISGVDYISYIHCLPRFLYLETEDRRLWKQDSIRGKIFVLGKAFTPILKKIDHLGIVNSSLVLANSHYTAKQIKDVYGCKAPVWYPFVDTTLFKVYPDEFIREVFSRYQITGPLILSTGRIVPVRRLELLIAAMRDVTKVFPSATLIATGEVSQNNINYVQNLIKLATSFGIERNVKFLGLIPSIELAKLYNAADVYAHVCPHEPFGLSPVEAMACGTPAVVWDDGAGPCETVINGKTGFRAKPYDLEDYAEKVMKAIDIDKSSLRNFTSSYVTENFSCEKHLKFFEEVLRKF